MKKLIYIVIMLVFVISLSSCFYNINSSKRYSSIKSFESETSISFYDLYDANYIFTNDKLKISQNNTIEIQFDKSNNTTYKLFTNNVWYTVNLNSNNIPKYYEIKNMDGYILYYRYFKETENYEFITNIGVNQYVFSIINKNKEREEDFFTKVKDYILLNSSI